MPDGELPEIMSLSLQPETGMRLSGPLCAPRGQTAGMGNTETRAPIEDDLTGPAMEHQNRPLGAQMGLLNCFPQSV